MAKKSPAELFRKYCYTCIVAAWETKSDSFFVLLFSFFSAMMENLLSVLAMVHFDLMCKTPQAVTSMRICSHAHSKRLNV